MASIIDGILHAIVPPLIGLRATEYLLVACATLLVYDYFLTLDREVFYVWGSRWSFGKIIFFVNRYFPIIDVVCAMCSITGAGAKDPHVCPRLAAATAWTFVPGMLVCEIILAMRTYAIWGGRRPILVYLVLSTSALFAAVIVLTNRFISSLNFVPIPPFLESIGVGVTCAPLGIPGAVSFPFMVFMVNQAAVAALTFYRGLQQYRVTHSPILKTMFHDGLLYYIYTLLLSVANVAVAVAAPPQYGLLLEIPLHVVNSVCCTRVLLNIRGAYFNPTEQSHNGILVYERGKRPFRWGAESQTSGTSGTTVAPSDLDHHPKETGGNGWMWNDEGFDPSTRLSLRPMSPFQCDLPDFV